MKAGLFSLMGSLALLAGCAPKQAAPPPPPPPAPAPAPKPLRHVFVLLPHEEGTPSAIVVTNAHGSRTIEAPYGAVRVEALDREPGAPAQMGESEVRRLFGAEIDAIPLAPAAFTLYFILNSDELTAESAARIPEILRAVRERRSTDIGVIGHTDTTGEADANYRLGLRRAERLALLLVADGVEQSSILVVSHGEGDLLVKTEDNMAEPRNRRVEVLVR